MELKENNGRLEVELPASADLATAGELRDLLLDALAKDSGADVVLNGRAVERIATAVIQVVLAGASAFRTAARRLDIEDASQAMIAAFRQLGLGEDFDNLIVFS
ncbi:MAG TPA: STAS domain-containing protein [Magnetospirillum sp.]|nr:STAS domain-containing protein [Magnetospirillum sp.]